MGFLRRFFGAIYCDSETNNCHKGELGQPAAGVYFN